MHGFSYKSRYYALVAKMGCLAVGGVWAVRVLPTNGSKAALMFADPVFASLKCTCSLCDADPVLHLPLFAGTWASTPAPGQACTSTTPRTRSTHSSKRCRGQLASSSQHNRTSSLGVVLAVSLHVLHATLLCAA